MSAETKACTKCGEVKADDMFPSNGRGGTANRCKSCAARLAAEWRERNIDRARAAHRQRYHDAKARQEGVPDGQTKACTTCGKTIPLDQFANNPLGEFGKRSSCRPCSAAARREWYAMNRDERREIGRRRREENPEAARTWRKTSRLRRREVDDAATRQKRDRHQAETLDTARNFGKEWTGPELEVAADYSRSAVEVARTLGRTYTAVVTVRRLLHTDPRKARMAGTDVEKVQ